MISNYCQTPRFGGMSASIYELCRKAPDEKVWTDIKDFVDKEGVLENAVIQNIRRRPNGSMRITGQAEGDTVSINLLGAMKPSKNDPELYAQCLKAVDHNPALAERLYRLIIGGANETVFPRTLDEQVQAARKEVPLLGTDRAFLSDQNCFVSGEQAKYTSVSHPMLNHGKQQLSSPELDVVVSQTPDAVTVHELKPKNDFVIPKRETGGYL